MKKRVLSIVAGLFLIAGTLFSQTLTDVIHEFNAGVESLNGQSYETALTQFNNCLSLCDVVGDEAADMKKQAQSQLVGTQYRQATTLLKRKQYDQAIVYLENTIRLSGEYATDEDLAEKAGKYLPSLYLREGNVLYQQGDYASALQTFDKVIGMHPEMYKAHQGKGLVFMKMENVEGMLEEFADAREKAAVAGDQEVINDINSAINNFYFPLIENEYASIDPEEEDYTYLIGICEEALAANDQNSWAYYRIGSARNSMVEYDAAVEALNKAIAYETDPAILSALYFELGIAYQNSVMYAEACEAFNKVTAEPFYTKAENKMMTVPDCN